MPQMPTPENPTQDQQVLILSLAVNEMQTKISKHHTLLVEGNGEKPLPERVRNLERFQDRFEYWAKFLGGALILNFLGFAGGIIVAVVRFLPVLERLANQP